MKSHVLRLVFDGLDASRHEMPTALEKQITAGAQEFLGAHAYYFTTGRVPANVNDHSRYFQLKDIRIKKGSWEAFFAAYIAYDLLKKYVHHLNDDVAGYAAYATKNCFKYLVKLSYSAWQQNRPISECTFDRIEPVFADRGGNGAPIIDIDVEGIRQRKLLFERTKSSMGKITSPLGRAATHLDIYFDDEPLDRIENRYTAAEVSSAVLAFRNNLTNRGIVRNTA